MAAPPLPAPGDWPQLVNALQLAGLARELASHSELLSVDGDLFRLRVAIKSYAESANVERLRAALTQHFGRPIRVAVEVGTTAGATTAASLAEQAPRYAALRGNRLDELTMANRNWRFGYE